MNLKIGVGITALKIGVMTKEDKALMEELLDFAGIKTMSAKEQKQMLSQVVKMCDEDSKKMSEIDPLSHVAMA